MARYQTEYANAAKAIRKTLKQHFPNTVFRVTSKGYSGGDHVRIEWNDGPTDADVSALVNRYEYGSFDGQTDMYNVTNHRDDIPQTKYLHTNRHASPEALQAIVDEVNRLYGFALTVRTSDYDGTGSIVRADWDEERIAYKKFQETSYEQDAILYQPQPELSPDEMEYLKRRFNGMDLQRIEQSA
jgi:hypothetical protein